MPLTLSAWRSKTFAQKGASGRMGCRGVFIHELSEEHVTKWFTDVNNRTRPGAANRPLEILKNMLNKAKVWGYREILSLQWRDVKDNGNSNALAEAERTSRLTRIATAPGSISFSRYTAESSTKVDVAFQR